MILRQFFEPGLAQYAYLVGCAASGEALLIDPHVDIEPYQRVAAAEGLRMTAVAETHVHADFVSGAPALAQATGATLYVSGEGDPAWRSAYLGTPGVQALHHQDRFAIGRIRIDVRHTPGHTPEHVIFVVTDEAVTAAPLGIFSGDLLFVGDVGRPDLLETAAGERGSRHDAAQQLFRSIQSLSDLPDRTLVWPAHGSGSACGKSLGGVPVTSMGYERLTNWGLADQDEDAFVSTVLADQPDPPLYFAEMKRINRAGAPSWRADQALAEVTPDTGATMQRAGTILLDVRTGDGPVPDRALAVPWGQQFHAWAGSVVPAGVPLVIVAENAAAAGDARRALALIGRMAVEGWIDAAHLLPSMPSRPIETVPEIPSGYRVIDVRSTPEWQAGHLPGATHLALARLGERIADIDLETPLLVYCQVGSRAHVAAAALRRAGATVVSLAGGLDGYRQRQSSSQTARE